MKSFSLLLVALFLLSIPDAIAQEQPHWTSDLNIKVGYGNNTGYHTDLNVTGFERFTPDHGTFRLGIGKDFQLTERWSLQAAIELDWVIEITEFTATPAATGLNRTIGSSSNSGGDLQYTISLPFNYNILNDKNSQLGLAFGPELNFNFVEVFGGGGFSLGENGSTVNYDEISYENTLFRPSALVALNYKTRFGNLPVRAQAFFSYSFTNQYSGSFEYTNNFNGESQTGDFEMRGHRAGLSLAFFPFNNGSPEKKEKRVKEKKVTKERSNNIGSSRFGFKAGVNFSDIIGTDFETGEKTGFIGTEIYGGLFADTKIAQKWSIQTEATFSMTSDFFFIETPVLLKRQIVKNLSAFAGPKAQYVFDTFDSVERNLGLGADLGVQYDLPKDFFIEARYGFGFTEQINENFLGIENGRRNVLRIGAGFKF